jgi:hypothetical protein
VDTFSSEVSFLVEAQPAAPTRHIRKTAVNRSRKGKLDSMSLLEANRTILAKPFFEKIDRKMESITYEVAVLNYGLIPFRHKISDGDIRLNGRDFHFADKIPAAMDHHFATNENSLIGSDIQDAEAPF